MLESRGLVKLGIFYGEDLAISSWWGSLAAKIAVSGIMDLVAEMATYAKSSMRPNTFVMPFFLLSLSWIILLCLNPEVRRFAYYGIRWEDCEGTPCYSTLGESRVAAFRLTSVGFFALLEWLNCLLRSSWWDHSPVEGIGISELASIPCAYSGYYVMTLGETLVSDPVGSSWVRGSSETSFRASLGRGILEDLLTCHSFSRVSFSCVASYKCSFTSF